MGQLVYDADGLMMRRRATKRHQSFSIKVPSPTTGKVIAELTAGKGRYLDTAEAQMADLNNEG